jgi:hypothetical protein
MRSSHRRCRVIDDKSKQQQQQPSKRRACADLPAGRRELLLDTHKLKHIEQIIYISSVLTKRGTINTGRHARWPPSGSRGPNRLNEHWIYRYLKVLTHRYPAHVYTYTHVCMFLIEYVGLYTRVVPHIPMCGRICCESRGHAQIDLRRCYLTSLFVSVSASVRESEFVLCILGKAHKCSRAKCNAILQIKHHTCARPMFA